MNRSRRVECVGHIACSVREIGNAYLEWYIPVLNYKICHEDTGFSSTNALNLYFEDARFELRFFVISFCPSWKITGQHINQETAAFFQAISS
jgi:hypothetical protein